MDRSDAHHVTCTILRVLRSLTVIAEMHSVFAAQSGGPADYRCSPTGEPGLASEGLQGMSSAPAGEPRTCPGLFGWPGETTSGTEYFDAAQIAIHQPASVPVKRRSKAGRDLDVVSLSLARLAAPARHCGMRISGRELRLGCMGRAAADGQQVRWRLYERYLDDDDAVHPPTERMSAFVGALLKRWRDATEDVEEASPWSAGPLICGVGGPLVYLPLRWDRAEEASAYVAALAD